MEKGPRAFSSSRIFLPFRLSVYCYYYYCFVATDDGSFQSAERKIDWAAKMVMISEYVRKNKREWTKNNELANAVARLRGRTNVACRHQGTTKCICSIQETNKPKTNRIKINTQ